MHKVNTRRKRMAPFGRLSLRGAFTGDTCTMTCFGAIRLFCGFVFFPEKTGKKALRSVPSGGGEKVNPLDGP